MMTGVISSRGAEQNDRCWTKSSLPATQITRFRDAQVRGRSRRLENQRILIGPHLDGTRLGRGVR